MTTNVIDSHLHVWANSKEASSKFPYSQEPPTNLKETGCTDALILEMDKHGVDGALIVQPINHQFDHSYILNAIQSHPQRFKGMMLHDPSQSSETAVETLETLCLQGCVGVRFNPYLWPKKGDGWEQMSKGAGLAVYQRCAELQMPVGVMCFQGLDLHYNDIVALLEASPDTTLILDHFGFTSIHKPEVFDQLLSLAKYPQVYVKISALFRLEDASPYEKVRTDRFLPLLKAFGSDRLMYGSDFPFVQEQPEGYGMVQRVSEWIDNEDDRANIMGKTAEKVFGPWGVASAPPPAST